MNRMGRMSFTVDSITSDMRTAAVKVFVDMCGAVKKPACYQQVQVQALESVMFHICKCLKIQHIICLSVYSLSLKVEQQ